MLLQTLLLATALVAQDPKPGARTLEDRLKKLDEKLAVLEKKQKDLADENAVLEKKSSELKSAREKYVRMIAANWTQVYALPAGLTEAQSAEFQALWTTWMLEDLNKPFDAARWASREESLKSKLSADQVQRLRRTIHEHREEGLLDTVVLLLRSVPLSAEKIAVIKKAAKGRLPVYEDILIPEAHPGKFHSASQVLQAIEASLPDLASTLTAEELKSLRACVEQGKLKQR